jgi:hypothetical protein
MKEKTNKFSLDSKVLDFSNIFSQNEPARTNIIPYLELNLNICYTVSENKEATTYHVLILIDDIKH